MVWGIPLFVGYVYKDVPMIVYSLFIMFFSIGCTLYAIFLSTFCDYEVKPDAPGYDSSKSFWENVSRISKSFAGIDTSNASKKAEDTSKAEGTSKDA
ncbi:1304_t:CDS:2, partial [Cetraspora pellucida]